MGEKRKEANPVHADPGYERRDVNVKKLIIIGAVIFALLVVILIFLNEFFIITKEDIVYQQSLKPESEALLQLRAREDSLLNSYGIVNADSGFYRIPIDRAMGILVEETGKKR